MPCRARLAHMRRVCVSTANAPALIAEMQEAPSESGARIGSRPQQPRRKRSMQKRGIQSKCAAHARSCAGASSMWNERYVSLRRACSQMLVASCDGLPRRMWPRLRSHRSTRLAARCCAVASHAMRMRTAEEGPVGEGVGARRCGAVDDVRDPMSLESLPPLRTLFAAHEAAFPRSHIAAACALRTAADCTDPTQATYAGMVRASSSGGDSQVLGKWRAHTLERLQLPTLVHGLQGELCLPTSAARLLAQHASHTSSCSDRYAPTPEGS